MVRPETFSKAIKSLHVCPVPVYDLANEKIQQMSHILAFLHPSMQIDRLLFGGDFLGRWGHKDEDENDSEDDDEDATVNEANVDEDDNDDENDNDDDNDDKEDDNADDSGDGNDADKDADDRGDGNDADEDADDRGDGNDADDELADAIQNDTSVRQLALKLHQILFPHVTAIKERIVLDIEKCLIAVCDNRSGVLAQSVAMTLNGYSESLCSPAQLDHLFILRVASGVMINPLHWIVDLAWQHQKPSVTRVKIDLFAMLYDT